MKNMINNIRAYLELFRIFESQLIAGTAAMTLIMLGISDIGRISLLFFVILTGASGILSWNDSLDITEDIIAHPERPIISGRISITQARSIGSILIAISMILSIIFSPRLVILGIVGIIIGIGYSLTSKSRFILIAPMKNIVVVGTTAIFLMLIPNVLERPADVIYYIFVISLCSILFGYEILKDIRDVKGDLVAGYKTLPILKGITKSSWIAAFFFAISCVIIGIAFITINYIPEASISLGTTILVLLPFNILFKNPIPEKSDKTRVIVVGILLISLSVVTVLLYLRLIE